MKYTNKKFTWVKLIVVVLCRITGFVVFCRVRSSTKRSKKYNLRMETTETDELLTNGFNLKIRESELTKTAISDSIDHEAEARVLVLYTGGTIGMKSNNHGGNEICVTKSL